MDSAAVRRSPGIPGQRASWGAYCGHGRIEDKVAEGLPRHWTVELASPGLFGGPAAEMMAMPGLLAVQHLS